MVIVFGETKVLIRSVSLKQIFFAAEVKQWYLLKKKKVISKAKHKDWRCGSIADSLPVMCEAPFPIQ